MIKSHMFPPAGATDVFMGCGQRNGSFLHMGIGLAATELFDQKQYYTGQTDSAKAVKNFHVYYSSSETEPIGFSKGATINLDTSPYHGTDVHEYDDVTKMSATTSNSKFNYTIVVKLSRTLRFIQWCVTMTCPDDNQSA